MKGSRSSLLGLAATLLTVLLMGAGCGARDPGSVDPGPVKDTVEASESGPDLVVETVEPIERDPEQAGGVRQELPVAPPAFEESVGADPAADPVKDTVEASGSGSGPDLALEVVDPADFDSGALVGGAVQETPVEPAGSDGSESGTADSTSAQGDVYTWHDGDRVLGARLQVDLVVVDGESTSPTDVVVAETGSGQIVRSAPGSRQPDGTSDISRSPTGGAQPVFRSESGELMTLPGGVILFLNPEWDSDAADGFFAANGIDASRVSELRYVTNGFFVDTDPGFASLELANDLAGRAGVELSSPNWWRDHTTQ